MKIPQSPPDLQELLLSEPNLLEKLAKVTGEVDRTGYFYSSRPAGPLLFSGKVMLTSAGVFLGERIPVSEIRKNSPQI
jgi:hypothetical protein